MVQDIGGWSSARLYTEIISLSERHYSATWPEKYRPVNLRWELSGSAYVFALYEPLILPFRLVSMALHCDVDLGRSAYRWNLETHYNDIQDRIRAQERTESAAARVLGGVAARHAGRCTIV